MGWMVWGSNPVGSEIFRAHSDWPWGTHRIPINGCWVIPWCKVAGAGVDNSLPSGTKVKEGKELYLYSLSAFMACYRVNFTLLYFTLLYFTLFIFKFALVGAFCQTELESSDVNRK
jgi:hypothetical protein